MSSEQEVDIQGETCLRCLTGTGVGASGGVVGIVKVRLKTPYLHLLECITYLNSFPVEFTFESTSCFIN